MKRVKIKTVCVKGANCQAEPTPKKDVKRQTVRKERRLAKEELTRARTEEKA